MWTMADSCMHVRRDEILSIHVWGVMCGKHKNPPDVNDFLLANYYYNPVAIQISFFTVAKTYSPWDPIA